MLQQLPEIQLRPNVVHQSRTSKQRIAAVSISKPAESEIDQRSCGLSTTLLEVASADARRRILSLAQSAIPRLNIPKWDTLPDVENDAKATLNTLLAIVAFIGWFVFVGSRESETITAYSVTSLVIGGWLVGSLRFRD